MKRTRPDPRRKVRRIQLSSETNLSLRNSTQTGAARCPRSYHSNGRDPSWRRSVQCGPARPSSPHGCPAGLTSEWLALARQSHRSPSAEATRGAKSKLWPLGNVEVKLRSDAVATTLNARFPTNTGGARFGSEALAASGGVLGRGAGPSQRV